MPIYEFYCSDCHRVFNFLSKTIETAKRPDCPRCGRPKLERKVSRFAVSRGRTESGEAGDEGLPADFDEAKFERAMAELEHSAEGMDEDDPRQMARLMRKLQESAGLPMDEKMEDALRRMEAGEDPDQIEEDFGELDESSEEGGPPVTRRGRLQNLARRLRPPEVDETLYDL